MRLHLSRTEYDSSKSPQCPALEDWQPGLSMWSFSNCAERDWAHLPMKLRTGEPWMSASDYGCSLKALTINLLVRNIEKALQFQREVLRAEVVYSDPDFAVVRGCGAEWMLHADHS